MIEYPPDSVRLATISPDDYYRDLAAKYTERRDAMIAMLEPAGFRCFRPQGAYYVMADISGFGFPDDTAFAMHLVENIGIAAVPGSCFFAKSNFGDQIIRFCFPKKPETLEAAATALRKLRE